MRLGADFICLCNCQAHGKNAHSNPRGVRANLVNAAGDVGGEGRSSSKQNPDPPPRSIHRSGADAVIKGRSRRREALGTTLQPTLLQGQLPSPTMDHCHQLMNLP